MKQAILPFIYILFVFQHCFVVFSIKVLPPWLSLFLSILVLLLFSHMITLISFSKRSLSVYKDGTDFHTLILYSVTLWNFIIISSRVCVCMGVIFSVFCMSPMNRGNFISSFPVLMPFIIHFKVTKTVLPKSSTKIIGIRVPEFQEDIS